LRSLRSRARSARALAPLARSLRSRRSHRYPPNSLAAVPFDAACLPTNPSIQFLAREASKPGGGASSPDGDAWTAVSTSGFASALLANSPSSPTDAAAALLAPSLQSAFAAFYPVPGIAPAPLSVSAKRWGAGFTTKPLVPGGAEKFVGLQPFNLAIAGDFVAGGTCPGEAGAISGLLAGERVATWLSAN
jgi:hypothetical protein